MYSYLYQLVSDFYKQDIACDTKMIKPSKKIHASVLEQALQTLMDVYRLKVSSV